MTTGIFGAGGFIGRAYARLAGSEGVSLRLFDQRPVAGMEDETILMDMARPETYLDALEGLDTLVLLVSASVPGTFANDMAAEVKHNVLPYARLANALAGKGVKRVVYLSSGGAVYGAPQMNPVPETHPLNPASPYGAGKVMIEAALRAAARLADWDCVILRPSNPIGRGQMAGRGQGLVAEAAHAGLTGGALPVWGDGSAVRNYFDVRDLARAIHLACIRDEAAGEIFNVGGEGGLSVEEVIRAVGVELGSPVRIARKPARKVDVPRIVLDCRHIHDKLGWRTRYDAVDAIREVVRFQRDLLAQGA